MGYKQNILERTLLVDLRIQADGVNTFNQVRLACDHAATLVPTPTDAKSVNILVSSGVFSEAPFTVPTGIIITGVPSLGESEGRPCTQIRRQGGPDTETVFITMDTNSAIVDCTIAVNNSPVNYLADYSVIESSGTAFIVTCDVNFSEVYTGTNIVRCIKGVGSSSDINMSGASTIRVKGSSTNGALLEGNGTISYTRFIGDGPIGLEATGAAREVTLDFCRLTSAGGGFVTDVVASAGVTINLVGTPIRTSSISGTLNRTGGAAFIEDAGTPLTTGGFETFNFIGAVLTDNGAGSVDIDVGAAGLPTKSGLVAFGTFSGSPQTATVTFAAPFADALYSVSILGTDSRSWTYDTQLAGSIILNSNSAVALTGNVHWIAIHNGEA